jgi:hypothetical protein
LIDMYPSDLILLGHSSASWILFLCCLKSSL